MSPSLFKLGVNWGPQRSSHARTCDMCSKPCHGHKKVTVSFTDFWPLVHSSALARISAQMGAPCLPVAGRSPSGMTERDWHMDPETRVEKSLRSRLACLLFFSLFPSLPSLSFSPVYFKKGGVRTPTYCRNIQCLLFLLSFCLYFSRFKFNHFLPLSVSHGDTFHSCKLVNISSVWVEQ